MLLGKPNLKLKQDKTKQWSIPAGTTCPYAGDCKNYCYASGGFYKMDNVKHKHRSNLDAYKSNPAQWVDDMVSEIKRRRINSAVRIHDTGDFFNRAYVKAWMEVINQCPDTKFYCYTKSLPLFNYQTGWVLPNFHVRFSYGGTLDDRIDPDTMHNARVFQTARDARDAGYTVCPDDSDLLAMDETVIKLALVIHGEKSKGFIG